MSFGEIAAWSGGIGGVVVLYFVVKRFFGAKVGLWAALAGVVLIIFEAYTKHVERRGAAQERAREQQERENAIEDIEGFRARVERDEHDRTGGLPDDRYRRD